jgi:heat-inducible transcriptional repressor
MVSGVGQLNDRAKGLLIALTDLYIESGEPVSSTSLSRAVEREGEAIPPSTVRLELGRLESEGYFVKPHSSGGRIPTAKAYRTYVANVEPMPPDSKTQQSISEAVRALSGELGRLLDYAGEVLALESGCLGFVTSPSLTDAKIARFRINRLEDDMALLRLELAGGRQYHHLARLPEISRTLRYEALSEFLTSRLAGRRLDEVSEAEIEALVRRTAEMGRGHDVLVHPLHDLITDARLGESPRTVMHGAAGLLKASSDDPDVLARAVEFLDDPELVNRALERIESLRDVNILIGGNGGPATTVPILEGFGLIVATYYLHARASGHLGILGPMRMRYARHVGLVRAVSDLVSRVLIGRELTPRPG